MAEQLTLNNYLVRKNELLDQCKQLSEDLINSMESWVSLEGILKKRQTVIDELKALEETIQPDARASCPDKEAQKINQTLRVISDLDKKAEQMMRQTQAEVLESMKANMNGQKLMRYGEQAIRHSGRRMDYRK